MFAKKGRGTTIHNVDVSNKTIKIRSKAIPCKKCGKPVLYNGNQCTACKTKELYPDSNRSKYSFNDYVEKISHGQLTANDLDSETKNRIMKGYNKFKKGY